MNPSEGHCLLLDVVEVLIADANGLELVDFSCLYVLDLSPLIFNFFSDLSALLEVIKSLLFFGALVV